MVSTAFSFSSRQSSVFLEGRKRQVERFLEEILLVPEVAISPQVFEFLCPESVRARITELPATVQVAAAYGVLLLAHA